MPDRSDRIEKRRYARAPLNRPALFASQGSTLTREGFCRDISLGGTFCETDSPLSFGTAVVLELTLPGAQSAVSLPGIVRWVNGGGMGVQFGLLGAVETHLITEIARKHDEIGG